jgi:predicted ABC-type ATPase
MTQLDSYNTYKFKKEEENARTCYYNSREINDIIYTMAQQNNRNIILDGTGQDYIWTAGQIENLHYTGYTIYICIVHISLETAKIRVAKRGIETGRNISEDAIVDIYGKVSEAVNYYKVNKHTKNVVEYDNNETKPRVVYDRVKLMKRSKLISRRRSVGGKRKSIRNNFATKYNKSNKYNKYNNYRKWTKKNY